MPMPRMIRLMEVRLNIGVETAGRLLSWLKAEATSLGLGESKASRGNGCSCGRQWIRGGSA